jgi:hypothetical protein
MRHTENAYLTAPAGIRPMAIGFQNAMSLVMAACGGFIRDANNDEQQEPPPQRMLFFGAATARWSR